MIKELPSKKDRVGTVVSAFGRIVGRSETAPVPYAG
jgi:hypothetical protein